MLELLWLLLPLAAAGGWLAARHGGGARTGAAWNYARDFHAGLGALLEDRREASERLFAELSDVDRDTADTHLALGRLFRRRGEVERAITLHESLLERPGLGEALRSDARYELARDYDSAGLLDRSERVFRELIEAGQRVADAYEGLLHLYERERDWRAAITLAREAQAATGARHEDLIAHYHCELAVEAGAAGEAATAQAELERALASDPRSARAEMMLADIASEAGDHATAIERYARVERLRPELAPEIVERRLAALRAHADEAPLRAFVGQVRRQRNAYSVIRAVREVIAEREGADAAERFFKRQVLERPSLRGLRDWARDQLARSRAGEREKVEVILAMLDGVVEERPSHLCRVCGFRGNSRHWRCPSCGRWDSMRLVIGAEGE